ncbi:methylsterol monooxygenase [Colletotrichum spaethianum]|uniref:Methylsterol monooxygenase n=1 Tax=Colletotrichum spaethianum TaxID=700344 RepID=A0AA37PAD9_9PEZI|nr:methylsterol monooxygenase [Colletotrichum spaethianum]GKT48582.1 methylsterol monooxygenase [Colletotrichum spaethianum]
MAAFINSTVINTAFNHTQPYFSVFEEVSKYNVQLNYFERLWAAWYLWMQNDTLATGIMSFVMHETVYFGRSLPFIIFDLIPWFHKYKIQPVSTDARSIESTQQPLTFSLAKNADTQGAVGLRHGRPY